MRIAAPLVFSTGLVAALMVNGAMAKAVPADAPAGTTVQCKDGTYADNPEKKGACSGHKGVKTWYGSAATKDAKSAAPAVTKADSNKPATSPATTAAPAAVAAPATAAPAAAAPAAVMPAATATAAPASAAAPAAEKGKVAKTPPTKAANLTAAPGGGSGLVWVNDSSKVYHCQGDEWYGKTKHGSYISEAAAKAKGFKGDHGKACGA